MGDYLYNMETGHTCPLFEEHRTHNTDPHERIISAEVAYGLNSRRFTKEDINTFLVAGRDPSGLLNNNKLAEADPIRAAPVYKEPPKKEIKAEDIGGTVEPNFNDDGSEDGVAGNEAVDLKGMPLQKLVELGKTIGVPELNEAGFKLNKSTVIAAIERRQAEVGV